MVFERWIKTTPFSRNIVFTVSVLIGTIAVYNWFIVPHTGYLEAAQRYESVASELAKTNRFISSDVAAKKKELKELNEKLTKARIKIFGSAEAVKFFEDIEELAKKMNCRVLSLKFSDSFSGQKPPVTDSGITVENVLLSVAGNYKDITALMNKLQNRAEQIWIDRVNIKFFREDVGGLRCDMSIAICVMGDKEIFSND
jgi:hypothetical protein